MTPLRSDGRCLRYEMRGKTRPLCERAKEALQTQPWFCIDCARAEFARDKVEARISRTARRDGDGR